MAKRLGWGIVGGGVIAPSHIEAINAFASRAHIVGLCDVDPERARERQQEFDLPFITSSLEDLLGRDDIDVVSICTPSGMHSEQVVAAAQAGKHILCEKPLGITREQLDAAIEETDRAGVKLACVFQRRMSTFNRTLRTLIQEGRFGRLLLADLSGKDHRAAEYYETADWRGTIRYDRGCLMNQGIHSLDLLLWLVGEPVIEVAGFWDTLARDIEAEDTLVATLRFAGGALGTITYTTSLSRAGLPSTIGIHGTNGNIMLGGKEPLVEAGGEPIDIEGGTDVASARPGVFTQSDSHESLVLDLIEAIADDREPENPGRSARIAVDVALAIYEASDTRSVVRLPTPA